MKNQKSNLKTQNYNSKVNNFVVYGLVLTFALYILPLNAVYATSVPVTANVGISPTPTIKPKVLSPTPSTASLSATPMDGKIQEIRDVVKEKVLEKIQEIKDKITKKGYVGILREMTDSTLTLETLSGERMITVDSEAKIIGTNKKEIKVKDLEIDQKLITMGTIDENNILVAKRIIVVPIPTKALPKKEVYVGRIYEIDTKTKTIKSNHLRRLNLLHIVKVDKETKFSSGTFADLKVGNIILVISVQESGNLSPLALQINPLTR